MKKYIGRITITVLMAALAVGATWQYGFPHMERNDLSGGDVLMTINGVEITENEYSLYLSYYRAYMEAQLLSTYGVEASDIWTDEIMRETYATSLIDMTNQQMAYNVVIDELAVEMGYEFDRDEQQNIIDVLQESADYYAIYMENGLQTLLDAYNIDYDMYVNIIIDEQVRNKLDVMYLDDFSDAEIAEAMNEIVFQAKHILISKNDADGAPLEGDAYDAKYADAQALLARVQAGEDYDALMIEYSEDPGSAMYPEGYTFGTGEMVIEFEDATRALAIGGISELVESDFGWHIIKREAVVLTEEWLEAKNTELSTILMGESFTELVTARSTAAEVVFTDAYGAGDYARMEELTQ